MNELPLIIDVDGIRFEKYTSIYIANAYRQSFIVISHCELECADIKTNGEFVELARERIHYYEYALALTLAKRHGCKLISQ